MGVQIEKTEQVWTVILSRPERKNAVDGPTAQALADAFRAFDTSPTARVAVLTGANGTFCSGADLKSFGSDTQNRIDPEGDGPMGPTRMQLSKPVIAAIEGYAVAGGLELAVWCDLRVAAENAKLGVFCRRWGVPLIDGGTFRLPHLIGRSRALDLILTGREVSAGEALEMGLVNRVVAPGTAREAAETLAWSIAQFPQGCMRADRASAFAAFGRTEEQLLAAEFARGTQSIGSESLEGAVRFSERKNAP